MNSGHIKISSKSDKYAKLIKGHENNVKRSNFISNDMNYFLQCSMTINIIYCIKWNA